MKHPLSVVCLSELYNEVQKEVTHKEFNAPACLTLQEVQLLFASCGVSQINMEYFWPWTNDLRKYRLNKKPAQYLKGLNESFLRVILNLFVLTHELIKRNCKDEDDTTKLFTAVEEFHLVFCPIAHTGDRDQTYFFFLNAFMDTVRLLEREELRFFECPNCGVDYVDACEESERKGCPYCEFLNALQG